MRDRYGRHSFGQSLLLARRLAEYGVTFVQANMGGLNHWDWAAGALIVAEAGGAVRPLAGGRLGLAAAGPRLVEALVELTRE